eukprot:233259_1
MAEKDIEILRKKFTGQPLEQQERTRLIGIKKRATITTRHEVQTADTSFGIELNIHSYHKIQVVPRVFAPPKEKKSQNKRARQNPLNSDATVHDKQAQLLHANTHQKDNMNNDNMNGIVSNDKSSRHLTTKSRNYGPASTSYDSYQQAPHPSVGSVGQRSDKSQPSGSNGGGLPTVDSSKHSCDALFLHQNKRRKAHACRPKFNFKIDWTKYNFSNENKNEPETCASGGVAREDEGMNVDQIDLGPKVDTSWMTHEPQDKSSDNIKAKAQHNAELTSGNRFWPYNSNSSLVEKDDKSEFKDYLMSLLSGNQTPQSADEFEDNGYDDNGTGDEDADVFSIL